MKWLAVAAVFTSCAAGAGEPSAQIIVQHAPLAGFVYYDGQAVWDLMKTGDRLTLAREQANAHDSNAVRLEWRGHMLGYVPRKENADVARQMDHGAPLEAKIIALEKLANGRRRISYVIYVPLN